MNPERNREGWRRIAPSVGIVALQAVAAVYFAWDAAQDIVGNPATGLGAGRIMEALVAAALVAGIVMGATHIRDLQRRARSHAAALAVARGAVGELIALRFDQWRLSKAEAEVALFALKGCSIGEIAGLRASAPGTVRSQLSQIYAKAGVTSQATLVSLFLDDLVEPVISNG